MDGDVEAAVIEMVIPRHPAIGLQEVQLFNNSISVPALQYPGSHAQARIDKFLSSNYGSRLSSHMKSLFACLYYYLHIQDVQDYLYVNGKRVGNDFLRGAVFNHKQGDAKKQNYAVAIHRCLSLQSAILNNQDLTRSVYEAMQGVYDRVKQIIDFLPAEQRGVVPFDVMAIDSHESVRQASACMNAAIAFANEYAFPFVSEIFSKNTEFFSLQTRLATLQNELSKLQALLGSRQGDLNRIPVGEDFRVAYDTANNANSSEEDIRDGIKDLDNYIFALGMENKIHVLLTLMILGGGLLVYNYMSDENIPSDQMALRISGGVCISAAAVYLSGFEKIINTFVSGLQPLYLVGSHDRKDPMIKKFENIRGGILGSVNDRDPFDHYRFLAALSVGSVAAVLTAVFHYDMWNGPFMTADLIGVAGMLGSSIGLKNIIRTVPAVVLSIVQGIVLGFMMGLRYGDCDLFKENLTSAFDSNGRLCSLLNIIPSMLFYVAGIPLRFAADMVVSLLLGMTSKHGWQRGYDLRCLIQVSPYAGLSQYSDDLLSTLGRNLPPSVVLSAWVSGVLEKIDPNYASKLRNLENISPSSGTGLVNILSHLAHDVAMLIPYLTGGLLGLVSRISALMSSMLSEISWGINHLYANYLPLQLKPIARKATVGMGHYLQVAIQLMWLGYLGITCDNKFFDISKKCNDIVFYWDYYLSQRKVYLSLGGEYFGVKVTELEDSIAGHASSPSDIEGRGDGDVEPETYPQRVSRENIRRELKSQLAILQAYHELCGNIKTGMKGCIEEFKKAYIPYKDHSLLSGIPAESRSAEQLVRKIIKEVDEATQEETFDINSSENYSALLSGIQKSLSHLPSFPLPGKWETGLTFSIPPLATAGSMLYFQIPWLNVVLMGVAAGSFLTLGFLEILNLMSGNLSEEVKNKLPRLSRIISELCSDESDEHAYQALVGEAPVVSANLSWRSALPLKSLFFCSIAEFIQLYTQQSILPSFPDWASALAMGLGLGITSTIGLDTILGIVSLFVKQCIYNLDIRIVITAIIEGCEIKYPNQFIAEVIQRFNDKQMVVIPAVVGVFAYFAAVMIAQLVSNLDPRIVIAAIKDGIAIEWPKQYGEEVYKRFSEDKLLEIVPAVVGLPFYIAAWLATQLVYNLDPRFPFALFREVFENPCALPRGAWGKLLSILKDEGLFEILPFFVGVLLFWPLAMIAKCCFNYIYPALKVFYDNPCQVFLLPVGFCKITVFDPLQRLLVNIGDASDMVRFPTTMVDDNSCFGAVFPTVVAQFFLSSGVDAGLVYGCMYLCNLLEDSSMEPSAWSGYFVLFWFLLQLVKALFPTCGMRTDVFIGQGDEVDRLLETLRSDIKQQLHSANQGSIKLDVSGDIVENSSRKDTNTVTKLNGVLEALNKGRWECGDAKATHVSSRLFAGCFQSSTATVVNTQLYTYNLGKDGHLTVSEMQTQSRETQYHEKCRRPPGFQYGIRGANSIGRNAAP